MKKFVKQSDLQLQSENRQSKARLIKMREHLNELRTAHTSAEVEPSDWKMRLKAVSKFEHRKLSLEPLDTSKLQSVQDSDYQ
jgi:hypothetical protein